LCPEHRLAAQRRDCRCWSGTVSQQPAASQPAHRRRHHGDQGQLPEHPALPAPPPRSANAFPDHAGAPQPLAAHGYVPTLHRHLTGTAAAAAAALTLWRVTLAYRAAAVPCALWVVNQLNTHLDYFYALLAIVMIGFMHVQLSDDGTNTTRVPACPYALACTSSTRASEQPATYTASPASAVVILLSCARYWTELEPAVSSLCTSSCSWKRFCAVRGVRHLRRGERC
jgi:hypothetical protein